LDQVFRPISPHDPFRDADIITHNAGPFGDGKPGILVDPPPHELGDPAVRVRIAGGANVRPYPAGRAIAADQEEELMRGEMGQLVETDQGDLGALPLVDLGGVLQMRKLDLATARPAPFRLF
jgi:hypothetical protein